MQLRTWSRPLLAPALVLAAGIGLSTPAAAQDDDQDLYQQTGVYLTGMAVLGLLVLALGLEGGVRLRQWVRYGTLATTLHQLDFDPASGLRVPRPGVLKGRDVLIEVNDQGFRSPLLQLPKPDGRVRLAFLGGSTTFCAEASRNETTWPYLVWEGLAQRPGAPDLDYVNGGAGGFTLADSRANLEHRVGPTEPDIIVIYHATNDLAVGSRGINHGL